MFILLSLTFLLGSPVNCTFRNVCPTRTIETMASELEIISPNFPENYDNGMSCLLIAHIPARKFISLKYESFQTESIHDSVTVTVDERRYVSTGDDIHLPRGPTYVTSFTVEFTSDNGVNYSGFKLQVFIQSETELYSVINDYNGVFNITDGTVYIFTNRGYNRSVVLVFNGTNRCPQHTMIPYTSDSSGP